MPNRLCDCMRAHACILRAFTQAHEINSALLRNLREFLDCVRMPRE